MQDVEPSSAPILYYADHHFSSASVWARGSSAWLGGLSVAPTFAPMRVLRLPAQQVLSCLASISGGGPKVSFTEVEIMAAFDAAEKVPFPADELRALLPDLWNHCSLVADALSVPISWVLLAEICSAAFLAPTSVLLPAKTIPLYTMPWAFILHPGATQTSGLMATYNRAFRQLELMEHDHQVAAAKAKHAAECEALRQHQQAADMAGNGDAGPLPKRPKLTTPPPMHMGFSSGSIDGVVGRMAETQNISRAAAFLAEGLIFLNWISDQCSASKGLITQLTDRILWDKVTVKAGEGFFVNGVGLFLLLSRCLGLFLLLSRCLVISSV